MRSASKLNIKDKREESRRAQSSNESNKTEPLLTGKGKFV